MHAPTRGCVRRASKVLHDLTPAQKTAVEMLERPVMVLAGAGTGKTRVLTARYLYLLQRGDSPQSILAVTFTNDATDEIRLRLLKALSDAPTTLREEVETTPYIGTIHSFCYHILNADAERLGMGTVDHIVTSFELAEIEATAYDRWLERLEPRALESWIRFFTRHDLRQAFAFFFQNLHELPHYLSHETDDTTEKAIHSLVRDTLFSFLSDESLKRYQKGWYTFSDLEHLALRLLRNVPPCKARWQKQFSAILIDEFQDTSRLQWNILSTLLTDSTKLFIVGDPKQSIYSFRNAEPQLFYELAETLDPKPHIEELNLSFRATPELMNWLNPTAQKLLDSTPTPYTSMQSVVGHTRSENSVRYLRYSASQGREQGSIEEVSIVTRDIQTRLKSGMLPLDIAILFRASEKIDDYYQFLTNQGIPVQCIRTVKLFQIPEMQHLTNFLEAIADPLNEHALGSFILGMGSLDSAELKNLFQGPSLFENWIRSQPASLQWFIKLVESGTTALEPILFEFARNADRPLQGDAFRQILLELTRNKSLFEATHKLHLWKIQNPTVSISTSSEREGISLLTVHASKGLEFRHVYLVDLTRLPPHPMPPVLCNGKLGYRYLGPEGKAESKHYKKSEGREKEFHESKRILYVAITRAKESLTLSLPSDPLKSQKNWAALLD